MKDDIENQAKREIERVGEIMKSLKVIDGKKAASLVKVMKSYYDDCNSFFKKKQYLQSVEAAFIVWAYVDAGLHLKVFDVSENLRETFTV